MKLKVQCSFIIEVEVPDESSYDAKFDLEENHCPGTGRVGKALDRHMYVSNAHGICWACALDGKCKIVGEVQEGTKRAKISNVTPGWHALVNGKRSNVVLRGDEIVIKKETEG